VDCSHYHWLVLRCGHDAAEQKGVGPMRLRFTIRDLLWLTVVVALAVGWWID
jgi:hypothetical protein